MNLARHLVAILALLSLFPALAVCQATPEELFNEAGTAYSTGNFARAASLYEELIASRGYSSSLLYNLASSYAGAGRPGLAILNYERAICLAPGDSDITGNLKALREDQGLFAREQTSSEKFINLLGMNQWLWLTLFSFALLVLTLFVTLWRPLPRRLLLPVIMLSLITTGTSAASATAHYRQWQAHIVVAPSARLAISPFTGASSTGDIKEGSRVFAGERHGSFVQVTDETGRKGWLPVGSVAAIIP